MQHPVFGPLEFDERYGWWEGAITLPFFAGYTIVTDEDEEDARTEVGDFSERGVCGLTIYDENGEGPYPAQEQAFIDFLQNQAVICPAMVAAIFDYYNRYWSDWNEQSSMPSLEELHEVASHETASHETASHEILQTMISLSRVYLSENIKDGSAFIGFGFHCVWDSEHGLGVLMHQDTLVEVGEEAVAFD